MPEFEVFTRRATPLSKGPFVTIQRKGILSLNLDAFEALGKPEAVELVYDRSERVMGFRPVSPDVPHAYRPRKQGASSSFLVAGQAFTRYYGIVTDTARRYPATMIDDVLAIDLKAEGIIATGPRAKGGGEE